MSDLRVTWWSAVLLVGWVQRTAAMPISSRNNIHEVLIHRLVSSFDLSAVQYIGSVASVRSTDDGVLVDIRASRLTAEPSGGGIGSLVETRV